MNKKILLTAVFAALSISVFAEVKFGVGVLGGIGTDYSSLQKKVTPKGEKDKNLSTDPNFGWSAGLKTDVTFNPFFALEFDVLYSSIGYTRVSTDSELDGLSLALDPFGLSFLVPKDGTKSNITGGAIELNLLARPQLPIGKSSIYGLIGIGFQSEIAQGKATTKVTRSVGSTAAVIATGSSIEADVVTKNSIAYQALTLPVGIGFQKPFVFGKLNFDLRFNVPLTVFSANKTGEKPSIWTDSTAEKVNDQNPMVKLANFRFMMGYTHLF